MSPAKTSRQTVRKEHRQLERRCKNHNREATSQPWIIRQMGTNRTDGGGGGDSQVLVVYVGSPQRSGLDCKMRKP